MSEMIPAEAVEAAWATMWDVPGVPRCNATREEVRLALEAAAPHMLAAAWDEGYLACVDDRFRDKELGKHGQRLEDGQRNPYRPTE